jgi:arylsulfatase A-like enzyme
VQARNAVVVLLDSLNRHMLGAYGGTEFATPNLDRFARESVRFTQHYSGSLPCMPARHDLLVGTLDFLWRPWGSIEIWEQPITALLRREGVVTKLVTDHPHLFETGGENYHVDFTAWDYQRGHESDAWRTRPDPSWIGAPLFGRGHSPYDNSRGWFRGEDDFPGPRVMREAARWLEQEAPADDRFLLFVDEFDPHEPFDTPEPYASMYDPDWNGPTHLVWPPYSVGAVAQGVITARDGRQIRAQYGAKLTMIDAWFGRLLDTLDATGRGADTAVIVCTDHGHFLGEKDIWGKPGCPIYEPLGHTPLLVRAPGIAPGSRDALTTNVDIHATLCDLFGVTPRHRVHGRTLAPVIDGAQTSVREWALSGIWGQVRTRAGGRQRTVVDVVEPVVDDAGPHASGSAPAPPRRPRRARPHAGIDRARDPAAVHRRRLPSVLGLLRFHGHPGLRPGRRPRRRARPRERGVGPPARGPAPRRARRG